MQPDRIYKMIHFRSMHAKKWKMDAKKEKKSLAGISFNHPIKAGTTTLTAIRHLHNKMSTTQHVQNKKIKKCKDGKRLCHKWTCAERSSQVQNTNRNIKDR